MKKISIGLLLPTSTILPMGKDFERGVKRGLSDLIDNDEWDIEVVLEIIGQGSRKNVQNGVDKLFNYHNVDIITGIVSNKVLAEVAEKFEKQRKPFFVNNLGEHLPHPLTTNPFIVLNSTHTWQQVWSLANWGVKEFGNNGMFVGGIYEAGYTFLHMMTLGMMAADPESKMPYAIAPFDESRRTADPVSVFEHIENSKPDFVFSCFCGTEATVFLEEYVKRGFHKTIPLLSLPYLAESFDAGGEQLEIYTTISSYKELESGSLNGSTIRHQNPFPDLGYESGLMIAEALKQSTAGFEKSIAVHSDRGAFNLSSSLIPGEYNRIYLVRNNHTGNKDTIEKQIIRELPTVSFKDESIQESLARPESGWDNPYLGI
jgi:branched-chain amino acid transport system substrate-binding protein